MKLFPLLASLFIWSNAGFSAVMSYDFYVRLSAVEFYSARNAENSGYPIGSGLNFDPQAALIKMEPCAEQPAGPDAYFVEICGEHDFKFTKSKEGPEADVTIRVLFHELCSKKTDECWSSSLITQAGVKHLASSNVHFHRGIRETFLRSDVASHQIIYSPYGLKVKGVNDLLFPGYIMHMWLP